MERLNNSQREVIYNLTKMGKSLSYISKQLNKGKTTIYYHVRKKFGRKIEKPTINFSDKERIGEIIGLFAGDGSFTFVKNTGNYTTTFFFNTKDKHLFDYYKDVLTKIFSKKPYLHSSGSSTILRYRSKLVIEFIKDFLIWEKSKKTYTIHLKQFLTNEDFIRGFLRGLIDSDGYVRENRKEIIFGTTSRRLLLNFIKSCLYLGLLNFKVYKQTRNRRKSFFKVYFSKEAAVKFYNTIKPKKRIVEWA